MPGDHLAAYLQVLGQVEKDKAPLRKQLERLAHDFAQALTGQYTQQTVRKHTRIMELFIYFVCWDTEVCRMEEITRGIANSAFRRWYRSTVGDSLESQLKTTLKKFFQFLHREKGLTNEAVLKSFQR